MTFREHTYKRRQWITDHWYLDEMVYGEIGPNNSFTGHAINAHFKECNAAFPNALPAALKLIKNNWSNLVYPHPIDFEELYERIRMLIANPKYSNGSTNNIKGIGHLVVYDIALHIGCNLYPKVLPYAYVYIHVGINVHESAEILLGRKIKDHKVPRNLFDKWFKEFNAMEIEDILCVYSKLIKAHGTFKNEWLMDVEEKENLVCLDLNTF